MSSDTSNIRHPRSVATPAPVPRGPPTKTTRAPTHGRNINPPFFHLLPCLAVTCRTPNQFAGNSRENLATIRQNPRPAYIIASVGSPIPVLIRLLLAVGRFLRPHVAPCKGQNVSHLSLLRSEIPMRFSALHSFAELEISTFRSFTISRSVQLVSVAQYHDGCCLPSYPI